MGVVVGEVEGVAKEAAVAAAPEEGAMVSPEAGQEVVRAVSALPQPPLVKGRWLRPRPKSPCLLSCQLTPRRPQTQRPRRHRVLPLANT